MAEIVGILASLVGPAIELGKYIFVPIKRQFSYLCCFNGHIKSLRDEAEKLEDARTGLQMQVDAAERKAEQIVPEVQTWLTRANEIQVNKSGIEIKIPNVESGCLSIISRYSLSKNAKKTTDAMKALRDDNKFDIISLSAPPVATAVIPLGRTYELESRKHIEKEIVEALESNKVNIIGICGMGGVGKTTMAQGIRNRVIEQHLFDEAVITVVGKELDRLKVLHEISDQLGLPEVKTLSSRAHQLHNRLEGKNKILIVVDDIWEAFQLEDLGIPCQDGVERQHKFLLTSRDKGVLTHMGAKVYEIKTLDKREAWFLFEEKSAICSDDNLLPIAKDIVKECSGLPLALTMVASMLKDEKDRGVWEGVLQQLKSPNPTDMPDVTERVYKPLKASYDLLHSSNAKSLFLLCSLFPEDSDISVKDLTLHCMGLRIFQGIGNLKQARNTVLLAIEQLKRCFLLLDGSGEHPYVKHHHVRMDDVVRDVAKFIASEKGLVENLESRRHHSYSECEWVSFFPLAGNQLPSTMRLNFPSLRMLMVHCVSWQGLEIEDFSFLEGMKELSVLSFKSISFKSIPQTMQLLNNLRALHLESCTPETISIVGELSTLEIFCCRRCPNICELPVEIGKLNCLKLLEFSDCKKLKTIPPGVLSNLIELEELTMVQSFNRWELAEAKDKESRNVNVSLHELQSLRNLTCLNIEIKDCTLAAEEIHFFSKIVEYHIKLGTSAPMSNERPFEKKMHLNLPRGITIGNWIHTFATTTEELCLSGDGSNMLDLLQAPNVKSLHLEKCSTVKKLMDTTSIDRWTFDALYLSNLPNLEEICDVPIAQESNSFKNLKELNLLNLPALEHLWNNPNQIVSLSNLSSISIQNCGLGSLAIAMDSLLQLQYLSIESCSMMEQVFSSKRDGKRSRITFPQLKRLELSNLESLTTFCQEVGSIEFPMLTAIEISNCPRITSLVSSIENNQNSASTHLFCSQEESNSFKNLEELILDDLPALEHLWNNPNQNVSLSNLSSITIRNCGLGSLAIVMDSLPRLQDLSIDSCSMMEQVFSSKRDGKKSRITFPQLKRLELSNLENLTTFCQEIGSIEFPKLTTIEICNCRRITSLVSSIENNQNSASTHLFCSQEDSFSNFPALKSLKLFDLHNLEEICDGPSNFFENIKRIEIEQLPKLKHLWKSSHQNEEQEKHGEITTRITFEQLEEFVFRNVENLTIFYKGEFPTPYSMAILGCPELTSPVSSSIGNHQNSTKREDDDSLHLFCKVIFGRLKDLCIQGCNNIGKIWCNQIPDSLFTGLNRLEIVKCDSIRSLFSHAIARSLVNLKYLEIDRCKEMVKVIGDEEEITGEINCPLLSLFPRLEELKLHSLPKLGSFCEGRCDLELPELLILKISECPMMKVFTMGSLISAHKLEHIECQKLTSIESATSPDGNDDDTSHLFCSPKITFGRLVDLRIQGCNNIGKIWCHQIPDDSFTELERLEIVDCDSIRSLFSFAIARNLVNLTYLSIERCKEMATVIGYEEEITRETNCSLLSLFPRLEELKLHSLPKLGSFCEGKCDLELPELLILKISGCPMMKVFTMGSLISAHKLEHIEGQKLTGIVSAMGPDGNNDDTSHLFCSTKVTFGRLKDLRIQGYDNIGKIWCHQIPDSFFTGLERLEIVECNSIRSLFSSAIARNLVNLTYLSIERCKEMVKVIGDEEEISGETHCPLLSLFPRLQRLKLRYLPKLGSFCEWRCIIELPKLEFVGIRGSMMKAFNMGSLIRMPNLIVVYIDN